MDEITLQKYKSDVENFYEKNVPENIKNFSNDEILRKKQNSRLNFLFPFVIIGYFLLSGAGDIIGYLSSDIKRLTIIGIFVLTGTIFFQTSQGKNWFQKLKDYFSQKI